MKPIHFILFKFVFIIGISNLHGQIIGIGAKLDKQFMFQASANFSVFFKSNSNYDLAFGLDYTTKSEEAPSGLQPQMTGIIYLVDEKQKSFLVYGGVTAGYLIDFNEKFNNQFRLTPHLYFEYMSLFYVKAGVDYTASINKVYPFISVGIGGGYMFRHFSIGF